MFPYLPSGLVVPPAGVAGLWAAWAGGLVVTALLRPRRPGLTLLMAPGAVAFWAGYITIGSALFGWTA